MNFNRSTTHFSKIIKNIFGGYGEFNEFKPYLVGHDFNIKY